MSRLVFAPGLLLAALVLLVLSPAASAQLIGLTHDSAGEISVLAEIDSASAVTPIGTGDTSLEVAFGASAFDPFAGTVFALGPDPVAGDGTSALFAFDAVTGNRTLVGNTGSNERVAALGFELSSQRLIAALVDPGTSTLRLVEVGPASAALTEIHTGIADCCVLAPGVAESRDGELLLVGRGMADPANEHYLVALSTSGDNQFSLTLLDEPVAALGWDRLAGQLYGVVQSPTIPQMELVGIAGDGSLAAIGAPIADCCILAPGMGVLAVNSETWHLVASDVTTAALGVFTIDLIDGTASQPGTLPPQVVVNNLFDPLAGLSPTTTTIDSIVPSPIAVGNSFEISATVASAAVIDGGQVTVSDGLGNDCSFAAPTGSCNLPASQVGVLTITASYSGTPSLEPSQDSASQTVDPAPSITTIASITPSPSEIGQAYTVAAEVTGFGTPSGTIDIDDGQGETCQIILPATSCDLNGPSVGARTILAVYSGDGNNLPSQDTAAHEVVPAASTTSIDAIVPSPSEVGAPYEVGVSVAGFGTPTGTITVDDGEGETCTISLPDTSCMLTSTVVGNLVLGASYSGDSSNLPSQDTATHEVVESASTTSIDAIVPSPSEAGEPYEVSVSVTGFGTPTGTITVDDGEGETCTISLPDTSCMLTSTVIGDLVLGASYSGDDDNLPSQDTAAHEVVQAASTTSITDISPSPSPTGQAYTVSVDVTGFGTPVGTVAVSDDQGESCTVTLPDTQCDLVSNVVGTRTIDAEYSGDDVNQPSSDSASQTITLIETALTLSASTTLVVQGSEVLLLASLDQAADPVTGTVSFELDGNALPGCAAVVVADDEATCPASFNSIGVFTINADYSGDDNNAPASDTLQIQVVVDPIAVPTLSNLSLTLLSLLMVLAAVFQGRGSVRRQGSRL